MPRHKMQHHSKADRRAELRGGDARWLLFAFSHAGLVDREFSSNSSVSQRTWAEMGCAQSRAGRPWWATTVRSCCVGLRRCWLRS